MKINIPAPTALGQLVCAANYPMAGFILTGLGAGAAPGNSVRFEQLVPPTREFFVPIFTGVVVDYRGSLVDGAGDEANMALLVPQDFTAITNLEVILVPQETGADMHFQITTYYGVYNGGEAYNVHTENEIRDIGATVTDENFAHSIADLVDIAALAAGDLLVVRVRYDATVIDSNAYLKGLRLQYT